MANVKEEFKTLMELVTQEIPFTGTLRREARAVVCSSVNVTHTCMHPQAPIANTHTRAYAVRTLGAFHDETRLHFVMVCYCPSVPQSGFGSQEPHLQRHADSNPAHLPCTQEYIGGGELFCHLMASRKGHFSNVCVCRPSPPLHAGCCYLPYADVRFILVGASSANGKCDCTRGQERACFYAAEVAVALKYMHEEAHVVYRDIKTENIMIDDEGHVKIIGMGLLRTRNVSISARLCSRPVIGFRVQDERFLRPRRMRRELTEVKFPCICVCCCRLWAGQAPDEGADHHYHHRHPGLHVPRGRDV